VGVSAKDDTAAAALLYDAVALPGASAHKEKAPVIRRPFSKRFMSG
jgi:hypothetical protein